MRRRKTVQNHKHPKYCGLVWCDAEIRARFFFRFSFQHRLVVRCFYFCFALFRATHVIYPTVAAAPLSRARARVSRLLYARGRLLKRMLEKNKRQATNDTINNCSRAISDDGRVLVCFVFVCFFFLPVARKPITIATALF